MTNDHDQQREMTHRSRRNSIMLSQKLIASTVRSCGILHCVPRQWPRTTPELPDSATRQIKTCAASSRNTSSANRCNRPACKAFRNGWNNCLLDMLHLLTPGVKIAALQCIAAEQRKPTTLFRYSHPASPAAIRQAAHPRIRANAPTKPQSPPTASIARSPTASHGPRPRTTGC